IFRDGALTLIDADGTTVRLGRSSRGSDLVVRIHDPGLRYRLALGPCLCLGEAYVDGTLTVERGDVHDLFDLYARNMERLTARPPVRELAIAGARRLAARIEPRLRRPWPDDVPDVLSDLFLDRDRQSAGGYFTDPRASLEEAEEASRRHLAAK